MLYKHGKQKGLTDVNPAEDVPLKGTGNGIERFLSLDEERSLRAVFTRNIEARDPKKHPDLRKQAIERIIRLRVTKNGKPRNAFIIEDVKRALLRLKDLDVHQRAGKDKNDELVFSKSENKKWWVAALEDAGIENYRWHDNRHTSR
jgi:hypothetical protein